MLGAVRLFAFFAVTCRARVAGLVEVLCALCGEARAPAFEHPLVECSLFGE